MSDEPKCAQCGKPLGNSVSADFCGEVCSRYWAGLQIGILPPKPAVAPKFMYPNLAAAWGFAPAVPEEPPTPTDQESAA